MHVIPAAPVTISLEPPPDPVERALFLLHEGNATPRCVSAIAQAQGGHVTRSQLARLECSPNVIDGWSRAGWLIHEHRAVYAVGHRPRTHVGRWWGAVLACGPGAATSHRASAASLALMAPHTRIDITAPTRRRRPGLIVHRAQVDVIYVDGLPATTVARTLVDLASCVPRGVLEGVVRQAQVRGMFDLDAIADVVRRHPRPRGVRLLRAILRDPVALAPTRSGPERVALRALLRARSEAPVVNGLVPGTTERVDFHWPARRLVLEIDGPTHLVSSVQRARDAQRDALLRARGWRVVRLFHTDAAEAPQVLADATGG